MKNLFLALSFFALLAGCGRERVEQFNSTDLEHLALLPGNAQIIGAVNISKIQESGIYELFKKYAGHTPFDSEDYQLFVEKTGLDLEKDLDQLYFAGYSSGMKLNRQGLFIATGNFSPDKISTFIKEQAESRMKFHAEPYAKYTLYRMEERDIAYCFPDSQTVIGGRDSLVMAALDRYGKDNELAGELRTRLSAIRFKSHSWVWMDTEKIIESLPVSPVSKRLKSLETIRNGQISMALAEDMTVDGSCTCADQENAGTVLDIVKGAVATAKLSLSDDRESVDIMNKIEVDSDGNMVHMHFTMSLGEIEHLLKMKGNFARKN